MNALLIFEKVNLVLPIEQRRFFNYLNDTVRELQGLYFQPVPKLLCKDGKEPERIQSLEDMMIILPLYEEAVVDNILFLAGAGEAYKGEFIRKAAEAYQNYWNENGKGRRLRRMGW